MFIILKTDIFKSDLRISTAGKHMAEFNILTTIYTTLLIRKGFQRYFCESGISMKGQLKLRVQSL